MVCELVFNGIRHGTALIIRTVKDFKVEIRLKKQLVVIKILQSKAKCVCVCVCEREREREIAYMELMAQVCGPSLCLCIYSNMFLCCGLLSLSHQCIFGSYEKMFGCVCCNCDKVLFNICWNFQQSSIQSIVMWPYGGLCGIGA